MKIRIYYNKRKLKNKITALLLFGGMFSIYYAGSSFEANGNIDSIAYAIGGMISVIIGTKLLYK